MRGLTDIRSVIIRVFINDNGIEVFLGLGREALD